MRLTVLSSLFAALALAQAALSASTYTTTKCATTSISGTRTSTTRLTGIATTTSTITLSPTRVITATTTLAPRNLTVTTTTTTSSGVAVSGTPSTVYATTTVYTSTTTINSTYTDYQYTYLPTTITTISTKRVYNYVLDAPAPTLPPAPSARALAAEEADDHPRTVAYDKRGRRVQCSTVKVIVSTVTGRTTRTSTVVRTVQPTKTVTKTNTVAVATVTVTPYPVTSTATVSTVFTWENATPVSDPAGTTQTNYYTVSSFTATTTTTASAYKVCGPQAGAGMGNQVGVITNTTSRYQLDQKIGDITNYDGSYAADCCNLVAAVPGAVAWHFDSGSCFAAKLYGTNPTQLSQMCQRSWNGTTVDYTAGDGVGGHGEGGLLQCGNQLNQYWVPRGRGI
ncbi:hypothetical protein V8E36_007743 [Tilletia maclaganii]